jgi:Ser/Thr protein kinase RdoA (MazF antagonist)
MASLPQQLLIRVLKNWLDVNAWGSFEFTEISGGLSGALLWKVTTPQGSFCLRRWPSEHLPSVDDLTRRALFLQHTWQSGFREIPLPQWTRQQTLHFEAEGTIWELNNWLTGNSILFSTREQAKSSAEALARFHLAAASFHQLQSCIPGLEHRLEVLEDLRDGALGELISAVDRAPRSEVRDIAQKIISLITAVLPQAIEVVKRSPKKFPIQWCHGDPHLGNFLFIDDQVTGIVDFAIAGVSSVARDIARLVGSMVPPLGNPWRDCVEFYQQLRPLSADEVHLIFAFHVSGTIGAAANWLRWRFVEDCFGVDAATTRHRLIELATRLESLDEAQRVLSAFYGSIG